MIEYHLDFDGDWPMWQRMCHKFWEENGYWVNEEMPGWVRATEDYVYDIRLHKDESRFWAVLYFNREEDLTAFLLKWA